MAEHDTGVLCFLAVARHFGDYVSPEQVVHDQQATGRPFTAIDILLAGKRINMRGRRRRFSRKRLLKQAKLGPVILALRDGRCSWRFERDARGHPAARRGGGAARP